MEILRKAPDKALTVVHTPNGDFTEGYNGAVAWQQSPRGRVSEQQGEELEQAKRNAEFYRALRLKQDYSRMMVSGIEKVGDREAYRVLAWPPRRGAERLYFDTQTGLLLRAFVVNQTVLGALPIETDYADYRDVDGVKIPFTIRVVRADGTLTYQFEQVQANASPDDSKFDKPAEKEVAKPATP